MDELLERLAKFDLLDLASGAGAVQLLPDNADHLLRLEFLAAAVVHLAPQSQPLPLLPLADWDGLLNLPPLADPALTLREDPFDYPFTDEITFGVGSFIVFPGLAEEAAFTVRHLLRAAYQEAPGNGKLHCRRTALRLGLAALVLGDAVARRAGLGRGVEPAGTAGEACTLPDAERFASLKSAVTFTEAELTTLLDRVRLGVSDLAPLVLEAGQGSRPSFEDYEGTAASRPILKVGGNWVAVSPTSLLGALRHALISLAVGRGDSEELAFRYRTAVAVTSIHALERMGMRGLGLTPPEDRSRPFVEGAFSFDSDKVLHLVLVCDSFDGYDPATVTGAWRSDALVPQIEAELASAQERFFHPGAPIQQVLHLVVFQGAGRATAFGFDGSPNPHRSRLLLLTAEELEVISLLEHVNQITLWQFAQAYQQARDRSQVLAFGTLDEFSLYRQHRSSYYLSDDPPPNLIHVIPGYALALRLEAQRRWDFHGVTSPDGSGLVEVALVNGDREIPIYASYPPDRERPSQLVEGLPVPLWVVSSPPEADHGPDPFISFLFVDTIAYWLWQFSPALGPILAPLKGVVPALTIEVQLLPSAAWQEPDEGADATLLAAPVAPGGMRLTVGPGLVPTFATHDNAGERSLMVEVLRGLRRLGEQTGIAQLGGLDEVTIAGILNQFAPLGPKKKLLFLTQYVSPQLIRDGLPDYREVQPFDEQQVLDAVGRFLTGPRGLTTGPIPNGDRVSLLNAIVGNLYAELQGQVASLSPEGLLERLVAMSERIVYEQEFRRLTIPTQIACFGSVPLRAERLERELAAAAAAGTGCRFLIEYVTARPPQGTRPFSLATYDRLLAIASQIIGLANVSDALRYQLGNRPCELLPSGRIAIGRDDLEVAVDSFMGAYALGEIRRAGAHFARHWRTLTPGTPEGYAALIERMDTACQVEFGYTFREIAEFLNAAITLGLGLNSEPKRMPWADFVRDLASALGRDNAWVEAIAGLFTLRPRPDFLRPPAGFAAADIYPWRFNRALSYVRRPLLVRQCGDAEEVVWGTRHTDQAGRYLANLCFGGRLKATSQAMRQLMGDLHNEDGEAFNLLVAGLYREAGGFVVRDRVKKIGGVRLTRSNGEDLGDIDVLVADPVARRLVPVEAKDFAAALTPAELSNEVAELFGATGRPGAVQRHLERTQWMRDHLRETLLDLGLDAGESDKWEVVPLVVLERELLSPFLARANVEVVSLAQLRERLG